jgi:winged helix-turn helix protein
MPRRILTLSAEQRAGLVQLRDHAAKPYLRERAAAVLKVADGQAVEVVARNGLLRRWDRHALYTWLERFEAHGVAGLTIRRGRGRKPAFSPSRSGRRHGGS